MTNLNNIYRIVPQLSLSLYSTYSSIAINNSNNVLNGIPQNEQNIEEKKLESSDIFKLYETQNQLGIFPSIFNKDNYKLLFNGNDKDFNPIKEYESSTDNTYNITQQSELNNRPVNVFSNVAKKLSNYVGADLSQVNNILAIAAKSDMTLAPEYPNSSDNFLSNQISYIEKTKASSVDANSTLNKSYSVLIKEERVILDGQYESEPITVPIYQIPSSGFSFGTEQVFDSVDPRGSQSPMRFYQHNPGRTLSFNASLHQQEYPMTPLLVIASALQDLARPYKHTDYSLIPKVVQVLIPGRSFRCYLNSIRVTSNGMDYQSWQQDDIEGIISSPNNKDLFTNYKYNILEGTPELKGMSNVTKTKDQTTLHYGLSEITCDFTFIILEEIKLLEYTSNLEFQEMRKSENELRLKYKYDKLLEAGYTPEEVIIDNNTGEILYPPFDENGNVIEKAGDFSSPENDEYRKSQEVAREAILASNKNAITLAEKQTKDISTEENKNDLTEQNSELANELLTVSSNEEKLSMLAYYSSQNGGKIQLSDGNVDYDEGYLREHPDKLDEAYENYVNSLDGEQKNFSIIGKKFISEDKSGKTSSSLENNKNIKDLLNLSPISSIDEVPSVLNKICVLFGIEEDIGSKKNLTFTPVVNSKEKLIKGNYELGYKILDLPYPTSFHLGLDGQLIVISLYILLDNENMRNRVFQDMREKYPSITKESSDRIINIIGSNFYTYEHSIFTFENISGSKFSEFKSKLQYRGNDPAYTFDFSKYMVEDFNLLISNCKLNFMRFLMNPNITRIDKVTKSSAFVSEEPYRLDYRTYYESEDLDDWNYTSYKDSITIY